MSRRFSRRSLSVRASKRADERQRRALKRAQVAGEGERQENEGREREKAGEGASLKFPRYRRTSKQLIKARVPTDR